MYALQIYLDTDDDFSHGCNYITNCTPCLSIYHKFRETAVSELFTFYDELCNTCYSNKRKDIIYTIKKFKEYLHLISNKAETFEIFFHIGNPIFEIKLCKIEKSESPLRGDGILLVALDTDLELSISYDFENSYNWDVLKNSNLDNFHTIK